MRKMILLSLAALNLLTAAQATTLAQSKIQAELGEPVQFVPLNQEMRNFINRYAKATVNKSCRSFDDVFGLGGVVLADPEIANLNAEMLFKEIDRDIVQKRAEFGKDAKVFMDKPRNVLILFTREADTGPMVSVIQIRGQKMLLTGCYL